MRSINGRNFPSRILFALIIVAAAAPATQPQPLSNVYKLIPTINADTFKAAE